MKQVFLAFTVVLAVFAGMAAPARSEPIVTYVLDNEGADGNASA